MIISGALAHIDTLHVDWHLSINWQVPLFLETFSSLSTLYFLDADNKLLCKTLPFRIQRLAKQKMRSSFSPV